MCHHKAIAAWIILFLIFVVQGIAASPTAEIHLRVVDNNLQPVHGATIVLYRLDTVAEDPTSVAHAATDKNGEASFENLPPARYFVRADLAGFLNTEVGPLPLTIEGLRSTKVPPLILILNEVWVD